ncbi:MAG: hypothetical protein JSU03_00100 [Bacteroidetes bacterium]|nr:hypothetical protein [Bacteroidota bacterium]MBS1755652.1 hypothetical protein [Bacteroidota bacterium]
MKKILFYTFFIGALQTAMAETMPVKNMSELQQANNMAKPGDTIVLKNGEWKNVNIALNCNGTKEQPIIFKAEKAGKVVITGQSKLAIGGSFIVVDGLYFTNGFAGDAVIKFRINSNEIANHCRVTNTVINNFNNPKRMSENYWVMFYGKNNRLDHCSFFDKKNMGVQVAVILDNEKSWENFHSIDHNYFGFRLPLASNSGEIIRVGVSEQCQYSSNTQITDNYFEHCDGETEIVSIKSGNNVIKNNLFKECQGSVVLRHGNNNTVINNIFLGNGKDGSGGVRIINKGQWVINNLFYKCRGEWFKSPLSIMNGVPNSPAFRYVPVTDAVIANNSFIQCTPIGFGIGSDTERTVPPKNVAFLNNVFYNNIDKEIYTKYDSMEGIHFAGNLVSNSVKQATVEGFIKSNINTKNVAGLPISNMYNQYPIPDSLIMEGKKRGITNLSGYPGFKNDALILQIEKNAKENCGAKWFKYPVISKVNKTVSCMNVSEVESQISNNKNGRLTINLKGKTYEFEKALNLSGNITFTSSNKTPVKFIFSNNNYLFQIKAGAAVSFKNIGIELSEVNNFITTDTTGSCNHSNIVISNASFSNLNGCFLNAAKYSVTDSIIISNNTFTHCNGKLFNFTNETDKKGLYNVEKLKIVNNKFNDCSGQILAMLRGGNDESTMGPYLIFTNNNISNCNNSDDKPLIHLFGVQRSVITNNDFSNSNPNKIIIQYEDLVRAVHHLYNNKFTGSGSIIKDKFVLSH